MRRGIGMALILLAVVIGLYYLYSGGFGERTGTLVTGVKPETIHVRYGSEKKGFLDDPEIQKIFREKYGVIVDGTKMGSLEMSAGSVEGVDALWPSSELAALFFAARHPQVEHKKHNAFSTPIVFYSWPKIAEALATVGLVERREETYYVINLKGYLKMMSEKRTWNSLGLPYQNGTLTIRCTDPKKSNSGYLMSGLLAIILNDGAMVDVDTVDRHLPALAAIFRSMGYMENSSGILFDKYIKQGQGAFPVIANYESLIVEFLKAHPESREQIKKSIKVLIPEPTVWSDHPVIALTKNGEKLIAAVQDEKVQKRAWEFYGFRSGAMGIGMDLSILKELGLPEQIQSVTPLPSAGVMDEVLAALH